MNSFFFVNFLTIFSNVSRMFTHNMCNLKRIILWLLGYFLFLKWCCLFLTPDLSMGWVLLMVQRPRPCCRTLRTWSLQARSVSIPQRICYIHGYPAVTQYLPKLTQLTHTSTTLPEKEILYYSNASVSVAQMLYNRSNFHHPKLILCWVLVVEIAL